MKGLYLALIAVAALATESRVFGPTDSAQEPVTIKVVAKKYEFDPPKITVKAGVPVTLELTSADRIHGFNIPDLKMRTDINPGETARVQFTPDKPGTHSFECDVYCGSGHPNMKGVLIVTE
jgi:cytochrome c oxidase subunit II